MLCMHDCVCLCVCVRYCHTGDLIACLSFAFVISRNSGAYGCKKGMDEGDCLSYVESTS